MPPTIPLPSPTFLQRTATAKVAVEVVAKPIVGAAEAGEKPIAVAAVVTAEKPTAVAVGARTLAAATAVEAPNSAGMVVVATAPNSVAAEAAVIAQSLAVEASAENADTIAGYASNARADVTISDANNPASGGRSASNSATATAISCANCNPANAGN